MSQRTPHRSCLLVAFLLVSGCASSPAVVTAPFVAPCPCENAHGLVLVADGAGSRKSQLICQLRLDAPGNVQKNLPLGSGFPDAGARNFRAEDHPSFRAGLGDSTGDFVSSGRRQEHNSVRGFDQHL